MIKGHTVLAVIPARSGSKRCPNKNFRLFRGRPLYEWSIDQAAASKHIDKVKVSFDIDRPAELCTDTATNEDVLRHHLKEYPHDFVVLLQPTSPMRTADDIDTCIVMSFETGRPVLTVRSDGTKNGAVYVASSAWILNHDFSHPCIELVMPNERSLDIDYEHQLAG